MISAYGSCVSRIESGMKGYILTEDIVVEAPLCYFCIMKANAYNPTMSGIRTAILYDLAAMSCEVVGHNTRGSS